MKILKTYLRSRLTDENMQGLAMRISTKTFPLTWTNNRPLCTEEPASAAMLIYQGAVLEYDSEYYF